MKRRVLILLFGIIFAGAAIPAGKSFAEDSAQSSDNKAAAIESCAATDSCKPLSHKVIAYYFHGDTRCAGCRRIETWSAEAIRSSFQKELESGGLEWKVINVDEAGNEHFNDDYQLYTKSLIIVDFRDGKQSKWKNLKGVWNYLSDQSEFSKYVSYEVGEYLKEG